MDPTALSIPVAGLELDPPEVLPPDDQNPVKVYLLSLASGHSRRTQYAALRWVSERYRGVRPEAFAWWRLRYQHVHKIRADLASQLAPATANKILSAMRQVFRHCRRLDLMTAEECAGASDCPSVKGERVPPGRALSVEEIQRLLAETERAPVLGLRNRALVMVLAGCGLRRSEVAGLDLKDYTEAQSQLRVLGKGNKQRLVPLHPAVEDALKVWIRIRRGFQAGPLFYRGENGDQLRFERITPRGIYSVVMRLGKQAEVSGIRPHDFRRTFISVLLDEGRDLAVVSKLVGHASVETTSRYDRRSERAGRKAVEALGVMWGAPV
jgi:site-specific recombinase XerD